MDDQQKKAEEALKQAQAASKSAEEALKQMQVSNPEAASVAPAPSTPPMPAPVPGSQQISTQGPMQDVEQSKNSVKEAIDQVTQTTEQINQAADDLHSKAQEAAPQLEKVEKKMDAAEKQLNQQLQGQKMGPNVAGYSIGELAQALIRPPQPTEAEIQNPEAIKSLQEIKQTKQKVKEAKKTVADVEKEASKFKEGEKSHAEKLSKLGEEMS